jgi:mono/diheme cytochrome c family protein
MNYPVWDLPMGGGVLIAVVSILHVFVSHFAVGGGLWLVVTESRARRRGDTGLLAIVRGHSRVFLLITLVFGAISGVGIWFTIALVSPAAVSALLHAYLWGWAMEWVFFVVEIAAAMVYWYGWDRLDARTHMVVGWIYFVAAWASLAIINGIVTFMLTPGDWLQKHDFWIGFFNPTYFPSLVARTAFSLALAGLFALATAAFLPRTPLRTWCVRHNAVWVLGATLAGVAAGLWYRSTFPDWDEALLGALPILPVVVRWLVIGTAALVLLTLWPLLWPGRWRVGGAVLLMGAALLVFATAEWTREAGRKPFTIHGYLYSTGLRVADEAAIAADGLLAHTPWVDPDVIASGDPIRLGGELFRNHCTPCHTLDGYNGLRDWLSLVDDSTIAQVLPRLQYLRGRMPAWHGTADESAALAAWLESRRSMTPAAPSRPPQARRQAWEVSCGLCHTDNGYRGLRESLAGQSREELATLVESIQDLSEQMPLYSANDAQRARLLDYLVALAATTPSADTKGATP